VDSDANIKVDRRCCVFVRTVDWGELSLLRKMALAQAARVAASFEERIEASHGRQQESQRLLVESDGKMTLGSTMLAKCIAEKS
jgi:hypothetical protein